MLIAQTFVLGGMRVEALLDGQEKGGGKRERWQFLPEIHGQADYFLYPRSRFFGKGGFVDLDFEVLRRNPWTLFFYSHLDFDTRKSYFEMRKATGQLQ